MGKLSAEYERLSAVLSYLKSKKRDGQTILDVKIEIADTALRLRKIVLAERNWREKKKGESA